MAILTAKSRWAVFHALKRQRIFHIIEDLVPGIVGISCVLILTGGQPSGFTVGLVFIVGSIYYAVKKAKRIVRQQQIARLGLAGQLDTNERTVIAVLKGWKQLNDSARAWLLSAGKSRRVLEGENLIVEGERITALYIVLKGELEVRITALPNRKVAMLQPGDVVGEMSFVKADRLPSASVKALEDSCVWSIPRSQLLKKLRRDRAFAARFYEALSGILAERLYITTLVQHSAAGEREKILNGLDSVGILSFSPTSDNQSSKQG